MPRGETPSQAGGFVKRPQIKVHANTKELFRIHLVNYFLTIVTLGFYRFWAKTRIRKYVWSHVEFEGARFEYTGTAKELFFGFLIIFFVVLLPLFGIPEIIAHYYADDPTHWVLAVTGLVQGLIVALLIPAAIYRARRYRLTRTTWRGLRGGQSGSTGAYVGRSILAYLGLVFSLGWLMPVVNTRLTSYLMNHTWFGSEKVSFNAKAKPLYRFFLIFAGVSLLFGFAFGLIVPSTLAGMNEQTAQEGTKTIMPFVFFMAIYVVSGVLFLSLLQWYNGNELRHFLNHTRLGSLQLRCTMTGGQYARLFLVNLLTVVFTLGLGMPWVYMRYLRLMETTLSLEGTIDYAALAQGAHERPTVGEGLADAFDVGGL